jgi:small subunit ribosomal protein S26e
MFIFALCCVQEDRPAGGQGGPRPGPGAAATAPAPAPVAARP